MEEQEEVNKKRSIRRGEEDEEVKRKYIYMLKQVIKSQLQHEE